MNIIVKRTQMKYRNQREQGNYNIFDIEHLLKALSKEGLIWCLSEMPDLTQAEEVLIRHFLTQYQNVQVYDKTPNNTPLMQSSFS